MHRGGQIFVLHNDIDSIDNMAESLKSLMKNAHIRIAHGQMPTRELEQIMVMIRKHNSSTQLFQRLNCF
jgi:transcription-repair coupling factor (superfamily II helicase)